MSIELGLVVRDRVSGFQGVAFGVCRYLYGCVSILVKPQKLSKDGEIMDGKWLDEDQLEVVTKRAVKKPRKPTKRAVSTGGPRSDLAPDR